MSGSPTQSTADPPALPLVGPRSPLRAALLSAFLPGAGQLYTAGHPEMIAPAVEALLGADRDELGRKGRAHAERDHSWDHVFTQLFALYDRVVGGEFA